jgi:hypothetical protein
MSPSPSADRPIRTTFVVYGSTGVPRPSVVSSGPSPDSAVRSTDAGLESSFVC